jgi:hypothetical protein
LKHFNKLTPRFALACLFLLISHVAFGQYIKGTVMDNNGNPLPFASIYIKNSTTGASSNLKGEYFLETKSGSYIIVYSFVGYKTVEKEVILKNNKPQLVNVNLDEASTTLYAVEIVANTKDRAKEIMRNVRDKRKFYLSKIQNFSCDTYLKTSLEKERKKPITIDSLKNTTKEKEGKDMVSHLKKEKLNLIESISETYYQEPGKYKEVIVAYHDYAENQKESNGVSISVGYGNEDIAPTQYTAANPYLLYNDMMSSELNFYKNLIKYPAVSQQPLLSPIASNSSLSYTYNFVGSFYEDQRLIYKIDVKPIYKSEALFYGTIYIEDSTWALRSVDLSINPSVLLFCKEFKVIQKYSEINKDQHAPIKRELFYTISDGKFNIIGNSRVNHSNYQINREFPAKIFGNEIKRYEVDAFDKDSTYWTSIRPITLKESELQFIHESDSLKKYYTSEEYYTKTDSSFNRINIWSILNGVGHRNRKNGTEWYLSGMFEQVIPFGIGGYRHKLPGYFNKEFKNDYLLETKGFIDYGFNNKDVKGKLGVGLTYFPKKFIRTFIEFGDFYDHINDFASIEQAFSRSNYIRTKSVSISQRMEIVNGLFGELTFEYSDQQPINNIELANWSNNLFGHLNSPTDFERYTKSEVKLELKYRIQQKYILKGNKKIIIGTKHPELTFVYRKGISGLFNSEVNFDYIEIGIKDEMQLARFGSSRWEAKAGTFPNKQNLRTLEYKYFRGSDRWFFSDPVRSFQLLDSIFSTPNEYLKANYIHHFEGSILNKVPLINKLKLQLAAGAGTLIIPDADFAHFEMFAGVERIVRIKQQLFRFGAYAVTADNSLNEPDLTFKFGISFYNTFTKRWDY